MKALSTTILIVVTAVVILVAALVLLTIFGGGVGNVAGFSSEKSQCLSQASISCASTSAMPVGWGSVPKSGKTCEAWVDGCKECTCIGKGGTNQNTGQVGATQPGDSLFSDTPYAIGGP